MMESITLSENPYHYDDLEQYLKEKGRKIINNEERERRKLIELAKKCLIKK